MKSTHDCHICCLIKSECKIKGVPAPNRVRQFRRALTPSRPTLAARGVAYGSPFLGCANTAASLRSRQTPVRPCRNPSPPLPASIEPAPLLALALATCSPNDGIMPGLGDRERLAGSRIKLNGTGASSGPCWVFSH
jgi:hypothetical protein